MHLTFKPGKEMVLADTSSRSCSPESTGDMELDVDPMLQVCSVVICLEEVMAKAQRKMKSCLWRVGMPEKSDFLTVALAYWNLKDCLL